MLNFRITKYNPAFRDAKGSYTKAFDEWCFVSEIGKVFEGKYFTAREYLRIEKNYVDAVLAIMESADLDVFTAQDIYGERGRPPKDKLIYTCAMRKMYKKIKAGDIVYKNQIELFVRLSLRGAFRSSLISENMHIHFGFDMYMYVEYPKPFSSVLVKTIEKIGLFVEELDSTEQLCKKWERELGEWHSEVEKRSAQATVNEQN